jgi:RNA polymerase sigma-70 factor (sigma-E family)
MRGDDEFSEFATARQQAMYRQAYLLCGNADAAQDLVQTTLLKLYRSWPRVVKADNLVAYGHKTMVRTYLDGQRRWRRERAWHARPDGAAASPSSDLRMTLLAALSELPPRARAVVVLRFWDDLSIDQTAEALGCSAGTVKAQSSRALAVLRERLGADFHVLHEN